MRVRLDEGLSGRWKRELVGHEVRTVPEMGWASAWSAALSAREEPDLP